MPDAWKDLQISDPVHTTLPPFELSEILEKNILIEET